MAEGYEKVSRDMVEGLPKGALIQNDDKSQTTAVYFPYNFRDASGEKHQERDYLGVVRFRKFIPNAYYLTQRPTRDNRPPENWRNPAQRQRALEKAKEKARIENERPEIKLGLEAEGEFFCGVGATALAAKILYDSGMVEDIARVLNYDISDTMGILNLGMHVALTAKPTYMAQLESGIQKFFGKGCPSSQRASELFTRIGQTLQLSKNIGELRFKRFAEPGKLLALDGTRIDCNSRKISVAAIGKKKDSTTGPQINFSMVCDTVTGYPLCYRWYSGNVTDSQTMEDFREIFDSYGVKTQDVTFVMDRGYIKAAEQVAWSFSGLKYIVGARTDLNIVQKVMDDDNSEVYRASNLLEEHFCYGVKATSEISSANGKAETNVYVYFSPNKQMVETRALREELRNVNAKWQKGEISVSDKRITQFFNEPYIKGKPLELDERAFDDECYMRGFFACLSNQSMSLDELLSKYRLRNEIEVLFRLMVGNLYRTTRVQSTPAMEGQILAVFVALTILAKMRQILHTKVPRNKFVQAANADLLTTPDGTGVIGDWMTRSQVFKRLQRIMLVRESNGRLRLVNLTAADKEFVATMGFKGLFDSAEAVNALLSAKTLAETIQALKRADMKESGKTA